MKQNLNSDKVKEIKMPTQSEELSILLDNAFATFENVLLKIKDGKYQDGTERSTEQKEILLDLIYKINLNVNVAKMELKELDKEKNKKEKFENTIDEGINKILKNLDKEYELKNKNDIKTWILNNIKKREEYDYNDE